MGKDLIGERFGKLVVIRKYDSSYDGRSRFLCKCDCGNEKIILRCNLTTGKTKSCGCSRITNIKGEKFGKLTAIEFIEIDKFHRAIWKCKCDCGNECNVAYPALKSGNTMSCGCIHDELFEKNRFHHDKHNLSNCRIFHIWIGMKQRCYNKNSPKFHRYGGRGITVCEEWKHNFQAFYDWAMSHGYADNLTIDRIDNDGNYEPDNCRWATNKDQANNVSYNLVYEYNGEKKTLKQWADIVGINYHTLYGRIKRGWDIEKALEVKNEKY